VKAGSSFDCKPRLAFLWGSSYSRRREYGSDEKKAGLRRCKKDKVNRAKNYEYFNKIKIAYINMITDYPSDALTY
jgi:hypothetical protein